MLVAQTKIAEAITLDIALDFLGSGSWEATQLRDTNHKPDAWNRQDTKATRVGHIRLEIAHVKASSAGFASKFNLRKILFVARRHTITDEKRALWSLDPRFSTPAPITGWAADFLSIGLRDLRN